MRRMPWAARLQKVLVSAMLGSSSYVLHSLQGFSHFSTVSIPSQNVFCRFSSRIWTCWNPSSLATIVNFWGQKIITLENENRRLKAKLEALRGRWLWKSLGDVNAAGAASGKQEPAAAAAHSSESFGCSTLTCFRCQCILSVKLWTLSQRSSISSYLQFAWLFEVMPNGSSQRQGQGDHVKQIQKT